MIYDQLHHTHQEHLKREATIVARKPRGSPIDYHMQLQDHQRHPPQLQQHLAQKKTHAKVQVCISLTSPFKPILA